uniref:Ras-GAP domain-containing protein n=1 Tax=Angiostrongylus cantonensis TaxID=6313 RepID=A0A0K0CYA2_ANGCA
MDKLERSLGRLWRRINVGKRREKRQKKIDRSKSNFSSEGLTSSSKPQEDTEPLPAEYRLRNQSSQISRASSPSQDLSLALVRLYVYARLKSLQNLIVAESSLPSEDSITIDLDNMDLMSPMEQSTLLPSFQQLSSPLRSHEFQKLCLSRESGYLTNSPCDYSSSSETLKQRMSPILYLPRELSDQTQLSPKEKFRPYHAETRQSSVLESYLSRCVYKSKCVTCVFEVANAGLVVLMEDILAEFKRCLKQHMLRSLHENNRRILCFDGAVNAVPENLARSKTEENIYNDNKLQAVQGTPQYEQFSIDDDGTITFRRLEKPPHRIQLCVLASNHAGLKTTNMTFESKNASMIRTVVIFEEKTSSPQIPVLQNNTVTVIQEGLRSTSIPVTDSKGFDRGVRYSIDHVKFAAAQNSTKLPTAGYSLFFVEPITGKVGVNPLLTDNPQGVYSVVMNASSTTLKEPLFQLVKKFHYVKDDMKMRYVFGMTPEEFAANRQQFIRKLQTALEADHPNETMQVFFTEPKRDQRNSTWTSVCFHVTMAEEIQNKHCAMSALSPPTAKKSELSRLYNHFKVINIESCSDPESSLQQSMQQVSMQVLLLVISVIILIIMLIALLIYICFIRRYKEHLLMKKKQMKVAEGTPSPMNVSPTFILPPMMQHPGFY